MSSSAESFPVRKISAAGTTEASDMLAVEEPLEIRLISGPVDQRAEKAVSITMRTPGNDEELAAGFLFTEGIVTDARQLVALKKGFDPNVIRVELDPSVAPSLKSLERNFYTTSSCGVCGKASVDAVKVASKYTPMKNTFAVSAQVLHSLQEKLRASQKVFDATGGLHASALFDTEGNLKLVREDVGRHNALDKLIGACLAQHKIPLTNYVLLLSGRISFELVQKASMAGIPFVAAIGAPSSLAVEVAKECGMTLVGFLRENRFTVYAGPERVDSV